MTEYLTQYRKYILECLEDENCDLAQLMDYHCEKLKHFQHERFIHLVVTFMVAIAVVMLFIAVAVFQTIILVPLALILLVLMAFYLKHYYFLENTVQQLYKDYDVMYGRLHGISQEGK